MYSYRMRAKETVVRFINTYVLVCASAMCLYIHLNPQGVRLDNTKHYATLGITSSLTERFPPVCSYLRDAS